MKLFLGDAIVVKTPSSFNGSNEHPAIVNHVWNDGSTGSPGMVNCTVLPDCGTPFCMTSVAVHDVKPDYKPVNESGYGWLPRLD